MVKPKRIAGEFSRLAAINSPPLREREIAEYLSRRFADLGGEVTFDNAAQKTGGECGNLIAFFPANGKDVEPVLFSVHMDTVEPGGQVVPVERDGIFYSSGDTVLGADDKAGVAEVIEMLEVLHEEGVPHGPIEVVVTIAEEIGLVGAKNLDYSLLKSKYGYALDTEGVGWMVLQAPGANHLLIQVEGIASHAGIAPEFGLSAIQTAALAISRMKLGRIDFETTANIGKIEGGVARNIVPQKVSIVGEARSHNVNKLKEQTEHMISCFEEAAIEMSREIGGEVVRPVVSVDVVPDFPSMSVAEDAQVVALARRAAEVLSQELNIRLGGGGSDANIFNGHGVETIILATGMKKVHTHDEYVAIADMVQVSELLVEIVRQT